MTDSQIVRELKRRLDAQTAVIEAIYKQLADLYARLEQIRPNQPNSDRETH